MVACFPFYIVYEVYFWYLLSFFVTIFMESIIQIRGNINRAETVYLLNGWACKRAVPKLQTFIAAPPCMSLQKQHPIKIVNKIQASIVVRPEIGNYTVPLSKLHEILNCFGDTEVIVRSSVFLSVYHILGNSLNNHMFFDWPIF